MKNTAIVMLVVLNVLLLAGLVNRASSTSSSGVAHAQARAARPGDYLMIPGEVTGGSTSVVYVLDTTNGWLSALAYDDTVKRLEAMPAKIDLAQVFRQGGPAVPPADGNNRRGGRY